MSSALKRGKIGEELVTAWAHGEGLSVTGRSHRGHDCRLDGLKIEVKTSLRWNNDRFVFFGLRDFDYDAVALLGLEPDNVRLWIVPKVLLWHHARDQLRSAEALHTKWLAFQANKPPPWLDVRRGTRFATQPPTSSQRRASSSYPRTACQTMRLGLHSLPRSTGRGTRAPTTTYNHNRKSPRPKGTIHMSTVNINRVVLTGNLTADPDLRETSTGLPVCKLRVASTARRKSSDGQTYEDRPNYVTVWGAQGENAARFLSKGRPVAIDGRLEWREWESQDGTKRQSLDVIADSVQFSTRRPPTTMSNSSSCSFRTRRSAVPGVARRRSPVIRAHEPQRPHKAGDGRLEQS